jgi:hypothetical protein
MSGRSFVVPRTFRAALRDLASSRASGIGQTVHLGLGHSEYAGRSFVEGQRAAYWRHTLDEASPEKAGVGGSIPSLATTGITS